MRDCDNNIWTKYECFRDDSWLSEDFLLLITSEDTLVEEGGGEVQRGRVTVKNVERAAGCRALSTRARFRNMFAREFQQRVLDVAATPKERSLGAVRLLFQIRF